MRLEDARCFLAYLLAYRSTLFMQGPLSPSKRFTIAFYNAILMRIQDFNIGVAKVRKVLVSLP